MCTLAKSKLISHVIFINWLWQITSTSTCKLTIQLQLQMLIICYEPIYLSHFILSKIACASGLGNKRVNKILLIFLTLNFNERHFFGLTFLF